MFASDRTAERLTASFPAQLRLTAVKWILRARACRSAGGSAAGRDAPRRTGAPRLRCFWYADRRGPVARGS